MPHLTFRLAVLAVTFCLSGFFSGSETALFSLPPDELSRMRHAAGLDGLAARLRDRPKRLLTTVLFGNMVVNVIFFSVSWFLAADLRPRVGTTGSVLIGLGGLLAILLGGEVMPKNVAVLFYRPFSRVAAVPLLALQTGLLFIIFPLEKLADLAASVAGARQGPGMMAEELQMLVRVGARQGVLYPEAEEMLADVIDLSEVRVRELMVPRVEMVAFNLQEPAEELLELFRSRKLTTIPVYNGRVERMRGVVHIKDVLFEREGSLEEAVRPIPFMPETTTVEDGLRRCREEGSKTAFVVDEYGSVVGLITIEDLLEEIVGEIADEYDVEERPQVELLERGMVRVSGALSLREWCELLEMPMPELDVDTVGGLVMARLDRLPAEGDVVRWRGMELEVESVSGRRAESLLVRLGREVGLEEDDG